jgi:predicted nucleic acid-binding protein
MSQSSGTEQRAVLDTSFWIAAYRAEVAANCLDLFKIVVPVAVEREILSVQALAPGREYPYATLFRHLRSPMLDVPTSIEPIRQFGRGEAEAIALAAHLELALLINERRAAQYAENLGVSTITVPSVIVVLLARDVISVRAARRKLELIEAITARDIIEQASRAINQYHG